MKRLSIMSGLAAVAVSWIVPALAQDAPASVPPEALPQSVELAPSVELLHERLGGIGAQLEHVSSDSLPPIKELTRDTLEQLRTALARLPQAEREPIHRALLAVETSLLGEDAREIAQAIDELRAAIGVTTTSGGGADLLDMRGTQIIGQNLYGAADETIGPVEDVVVSRDGGAVALLVSLGGFLGLGESSKAIPLDSVTLDGQRIVTSLSRESIEALPEFDAEGYDQTLPDQAVGSSIN